ncbi:MAG: hypothetical protein A3B86_00735 [Candidatus Yanofskybacteria bacterium RIFCSPHIGHO2_02_FULL_38_22b]|uniref:Uncharacterized protein n=1 Tax=Candidatus Yanofskybacteria bacterium RIFCSPHIGHO2_02_FULL_38_22b TaxID=1802673 RepID=A0A1F8F383_9BACT|nr:MAG: hypothetical protein A2816_03530 [Candidatus Yanofskybacteria bacterium RIFCSPHIGHO2_01_FULL_39_44]OGN07605.1 MAG: hypothetical protein A3B86_00735 [Candidatus Yanofskybacteria bacterium RIFCSPHIGHO2_02_FULL_38_22b]OGN20234.1 MAG: hypothetical protein A2910_00270 [Candidatus Yanofskybacteria bacterium RIFCSPLOWO2_01_FULL_39_28]
MLNKFYKKYIRIPPNESIDIREIMPIINHPLFQRLLHISQLGTTLAVFPGATHNRFEHALGVYRKTKRFCKKMAEGGFLNKHEVKNVPLFALMHDIGHGPFSHGIEELTQLRGDENENGLVVLEQMKNAVKKSGGDYEFIKKMFKHQNPLFNIVMDKNVGMDKLDYLERDTYHTGFGQRPDIESIFNYLIYLKGKLVIDKKSLEAAKQMQRLYIYMYKEVYLHKSALISQRFLQKMIAILMNLEKFNPSKLWELNDNEMLALIYTSKNEDLHFLYNCFKNRVLPRTGLVIRLKNREFKERIAGKKIKVIGEDLKFFEKLMGRASPKDLEKLESKVAKLVKVPVHKVVIVPTLTPWRFVPQDILYHDNGRILSLKDTQKEYFEALKSEMSDYLAIRVCIVGERDVIYRNSLKIYQLIKKENG